MTLTDYHIYTLPTGHHFGQRPDDFYLIYAPLSGNMLLADNKTVEQINKAIKHAEADTEIAGLLEALQDTSGNQIETIQHLEDYQVLYVLLNFTCNFSCSYCFSAKGRSNKELSLSHLKATLDYFISNNGSKNKNLKITFVGGGEPVMSWDLLKYGIEYASSLAQKRGIKLFFGLITNGSIINEDILNTLSQYHVMPRISFEILEDIQNKQRGQYQRVRKTINAMLSKGIPCEVRSMITPDNVHLLEEMTAEMIKYFPAINTYYFDPITSTDTFHEPEYTSNFYQTYNESFLKAGRLAKKYGKDVRNAVTRSLDTTVERYCNGEFCLTPEGTFSICLEVSSPQEDDYEDHIYGFVDKENTVNIDFDKFYRLKEKETARKNPNCTSCFVRWNCGGGCLANNKQYPTEIVNIKCESTRALAHQLLLEKLNDDYIDQHGITLEELIHNHAG
jgi:radical SAM protein with 4Fe4S-binding SPASM domain